MNGALPRRGAQPSVDRFSAVSKKDRESVHPTATLEERSRLPSRFPSRFPARTMRWQGSLVGLRTIGES